jgi:hypothetical protein
MGAAKVAGGAAKAGTKAAARHQPVKSVAEMLDATRRHAGALFESRYKGRTKQVGQDVAGEITDAERISVTTARERFAPHLETWDTFKQSLPATARAYSGADSALRAAIETKGAYKLPPEMAHLGGMIDDLRTLRKEMPAREEAEAVLSPILEDLKVDYATRRLVNLPGDKSINKHPARMLTAKHVHQKERLSFLKNLEGGTDLIDTLSLDKRVSGIRHKMKTKDVTPRFWANQTKLLQKVMDETPHSNKASTELTKWLAGLDPRHASQQIRVFGGNPIADLMIRAELGERAMGMSKVLRQTLAKEGNLVPHGLAEEANMVPLKAVLQAASLNEERAINLLSTSLKRKVKGGDKIPRDLAGEINALYEVFQAPESVNKIVDFYDRIRRFTKGTLTTDILAFHERNFHGGMVMNWIIGGLRVIDGFRAFWDAWGLLRGGTLKNLDDFGPEFAGLSPEGGRRLLAQQIFADDVAPRGANIADEAIGGYSALRGGIAAEIPGQRPLSISGLLGRLIPRRPAQLNPLNRAGVRGTETQFALTAFGEDLGDTVEKLLRITPYLGFRRQGMSRAEAAAKVRAAHVDYSALTEFERTVMRRFFPFYTFTKGMAKFVAEELLAKPGGRLAQVIRAQRLAGPEEGAPLPERITQTGAVPVSTSPEGVERFVTGFGLMHEDPMSFLGGGVKGALMEAASRADFYAKLAAEYATGRTFFQRGPLGGRELRDLDPTVGRLMTNLGLKEELPSGRAEPFIGPITELLASNLPGSRWLRMARTLTDPNKQSSPGVPGPAALINVLTGVRLSDLTPAARDRALRDRLDVYKLKELAGRVYTTTYIPKEMKERIRQRDPEAGREMDLLGIAEKQIERRANWRAKRKLLQEVLGGAVQTAP